MKRVVLASLFWICALLSISAQQIYSIKNIGLREGMSNGFVLDIAIDNQGFVWAATEWGLSRVTGNRCTTYMTSHSSIVSNEPNRLYFEPSTNQLWIVTKRNGINIFNCTTQQFTTLSKAEGLATEHVANICSDTKGGLWIAHIGGIIQHYDIQKEKFDQTITINGQEIRCVTDDGCGHLYIGLRSEGLRIYNLKTTHSIKFSHSDKDKASLPGNNVRNIYIDSYKHIWIGTNQGLGLYDAQNQTFRNFKCSENNTFSLAGDNIFCIKEMKDKTLWIGSDLGGISIIDLKEFEEKGHSHLSVDRLNASNSHLSSSNTRAILQDKFGNVWVGSYSTGIDFISKAPSPFHRLNISEGSRFYGLYTDAEDTIWLGGESTLFQYRRGKSKSWNLTPYLSVSTITNIIVEDSEGGLWLGLNDDGVLRFDPKTERFDHIEDCADHLDIHGIHTDRAGKVWIGSEAGLYSYFKGEARKEERINHQMGNIIFTINEDRQGNLWFGTSGEGIYVFNKNQELILHLNKENGFPSETVNHIYEDAEGRIWAGTLNGLICFGERENLQDFVVYGEKQGLADGHIRAIQQDRMGNIWVSTFSGVACLDVLREKFLNYNYQNGVPLGNFIEGSASISQDGTIYFGSPNGVCFFNPKQINMDEVVSPVQIIQCESIPDAGSTESKQFYPDKNGNIHLDYKENTFKFSFAIEDYSQEGSVTYSYKMEGLDDKFLETEGDNEVTFRNLQPGSYTFIIRAKLKNQVLGEASQTRMNIIVHPPLWLTWWAKAIYLLSVVGIILYLFWSYTRKLKLKSILESEKKEGQQRQVLNEERLRFYTNITHELRTPLTLILGPLEDLLTEHSLQEEVRKRIETIYKSAKNLHGLINELLEFRKVETQNRELVVEKKNLKLLVQEIGLRFKELNRNSETAIILNLQQEIAPLYFDAEVVTIILNNLLSNAIKYTPTGKIDLRMERVSMPEGGYVEISVADTGYGIAPEALPHIFDRYYQAKGKHQASGSGIGLALVKSLVELHEGTIEVESTLDKGTKITFRLSENKTYPNAIHQQKDSNQAEKEEQIDSYIEKSNRPLLLLVEDNKDIRQYIVESLKGTYQILEGCNGEEGIRIAQEKIPDIIVSDVMMPVMDGFELTRTLKEDMQTSHIPIILLTAKDTINDKEEGYDSGADSYLTKPFSAKLLRSRVQNLLESRRQLANQIRHSLQLPVPDDDKEKTSILAPKGCDYTSLNRLDQLFIDKLNQLIEENLLAEELDMAFFTDKMNMSQSTFYRKVKALLEVTPNEYIRKIKLRKSMQLLKTGEYNATEAATMSGFNNMGHFRESFKKEYGFSPSEVLKKKEKG